MNETFNGKNKKDYSYFMGRLVNSLANPSTQTGQFFVRGMHQWIPAAVMSSQPTVCLLVVVRMAKTNHQLKIETKKRKKTLVPVGNTNRD